MNRQRLGVLGMLASLVLLAVSLWLGRRNDPPGSDVSQRETRQKLTALQGSSSLMPRRMVEFKPADREEGAFDPYEEWGTARVIEHFMVPEVKFEGVVLADALATIQEMYAEHGGKNLEFRIEGDEPGYPVQFTESGSLRSILKLMAGLGGFDLDVGVGEIVFRRRPEDDRLVEQRFDRKMGLKVGRALVPSIDGLENGEIVTFPTSTAKAGFEQYGISFDGTAEIELGTESVDWIISNSADQIDRIRAVHDFHMNSADSPGAQVLLSFESLADRSGQPFEARTIVGRKPVAVEPAEDGKRVAPSIMTSSGQRAKVEIVRESIYPTEFDDQGMPVEFEVRNVGLTVEIEPELAGLDRVMLHGTVEHVTVGDQPLENLFENSTEWPVQSLDAAGVPTVREGDFKSHVAEFSGQLIDGDKTGFLAAEEDGTQVRQFIQVRRMGPDGTPLLPE